MWDLMLAGTVSAQEMREQYVVAHAVFFEALGLYGAPMVESEVVRGRKEGVDRYDAMKLLESLNPDRTAQVWEGRCVVAGRMQKTADGVKGTAAILMSQSNLVLPPSVAEVESRLGTLLN